MSLMTEFRLVAGGVRRRLWPTPEMAALRLIADAADRQPRYTPGRLRLLDMDLEYTDAQSLLPQWNDLFVRGTLRFTPVSPAPRVLDCGANVGLASLWLRRRFPSARITAFEADPALGEMLGRNLTANGASTVETIDAAVWSSAGRLAFRAEGADSGSVDTIAADTPGRVIEVPSVRLRDWIAREPIDLLKLDVEGAELEILEDCADVLGNVAAMHLEVHDFDQQRRLLPRCLLLIERAGFRYTLDDLHQSPWRPAAAPAGPFPGVAAWSIAVRAWRSR
jgi:FkbM family methyltransferase